MSAAPTVLLSDGRAMPRLGMGTWPMGDVEVAKRVREAVHDGHRLFDTAARYGNEVGLGEALRDCGIDREALFVTTKLGGAQHGYDSALTGCADSLRRLRLDYVDLFLIHWPLPMRDLYVETWRAFVRLRRDGMARSIGVSNFTPAHIERLVDATGVWPAVNQVELHPDFAQADLRAWHAQRGITTMAWSPLGSRSGVLSDPVVNAIAGRVHRTAAQVVLRWHVQVGTVPITTSSMRARMRESMHVFDFSLADEEVAAISGLDRDNRLGGNPDTHTELW